MTFSRFNYPRKYFLLNLKNYVFIIYPKIIFMWATSCGYF